MFSSHVPWLSQVFLTLPGFVHNMNVFRARARSWARRRVQEGSAKKDLFYHLVRLHPQFSA